MSTSEGDGPSVLFVCLGNICRSPMAEGVFRHIVQQPTTSSSSSARQGTSTTAPEPAQNLPFKFREIDSAGTGAYHISSRPDRRTMQVLASHGINNYTHAARQVAEADFVNYDWLFAMDEDNLEDLLDLRAQVVKKGVKKRSGAEVPGKGGPFKAEDGYAHVKLFGNFGGRRGAEEVADPYYGGTGGFDAAFEQVDRFSRGFLAYLERTDWKGDGTGGP